MRLTPLAKAKMNESNSYSMRYSVVSCNHFISEITTFHPFNVNYDNKKHVYEE